MLKTSEQAVMENYRTLACEVVLKAHNDLTLALIDLKCIEEPLRNERAEGRYFRVVNRCKELISHNRRYTLRNADKGRREFLFNSLYQEEFEKYKIHRTSTATMCKLFLLGEDNLVTMLDLDGKTIVRHAEKVADDWIRTGKLHLKKSVRADNFEHYTEELEE